MGDSDLSRGRRSHCHSTKLGCRRDASVLHPDHRWHELAKTWQTVGAGEEFVRQAVAAPKLLWRKLRLLGLPETHRAHGHFDLEMGRTILDLYRAACEAATGPREVSSFRPGE